MRVASIAVVLSGIASVGCVTTTNHLGMWEGVEQPAYVRVILRADGSCLFVAGSIIGDKRDGIGGPCQYSESNGVVSITRMATSDGEQPEEFGYVNPPLVLRYDVRADVLSMSGKREITLSRVTQ